MIKSYTPPKGIIFLTLFSIASFFGIAAFSFIDGNEMAPVVLGAACFGSVVIFFMLHVNKVSIDISDSEVVIYKGKKEDARYSRSQYSFDIIKRRSAGKKSPSTFLIISNETEKKEYDISILGPKNYTLIADELSCQTPNLIRN